MKNKEVHLFEYNCLSYFLIRGFFMGISLHTVLNITQQDGWLSVLFSILFGIFPLILYYFLLHMDTKYNIIDNIKNTLGKWLGGFINVVLAIFIFFFVATLFWNLINFISSQFLYRTPDLAISIMFGFAIYYLVSKGISVIGRSSVIFFYISLFLFSLAVLGLMGQIELSNIQPTFEFGFFPIFKGTFISICYNVMPLFLLLVIPKEQIQDTKHFVKRSIFMYLFASLSLFLVIFFLLSIYGIDFSLLLQYPAFHLLKRLALGGFIERFENVISILWLFDIFVFIVLGVYYVKRTIIQTFNFNFSKILSFILIVLLIVVNIYLFPNNTVGNIFIIQSFPVLIFSFLFVLPIIILTVHKIKKRILKEKRSN